MKIEKDLAKFESEIAPIFRQKFLTASEFSLTDEEIEKIKLFLAIMSFRSQRTQKLFKLNLSKESRKFYSLWQKDKKFEDFWKRNLGELVNCRSIQEVMENNNIDAPIKAFLEKDINGCFGQYLTIAEPKDVGQFVISDCFPIVVTGRGESPFMQDIQLNMYIIFPISPKRVIFLVQNGVVDGVSEDVLGFRPLVLGAPITKDGKMIFFVKKLYLEEVESINKMSIRHAEEGVISNNLIVE